MFGKILSTVVKTVSLPVKATNIVVDKLAGDSGSAQSRKQIPILGDVEDAFDKLADEAEKIDE